MASIGWTRHNALKHVRELRIEQGPVETIAPKFDIAPYPELLDDMDSDDEFATVPQSSLATARDLEEIDYDNDTESSSWRQLDALITALPALTDLHWDYSWPIPGCLEVTIRSRTTRRLHLMTFRFRGHVKHGSSHPRELRLLLPQAGA